ncbi:MAG TPA: hypothetical protein VH600_01635 [Burkholderiales bacterium]|jgi:hypothetical protein
MKSILFAAALALGVVNAHGDEWVSLGGTDTGFEVQVKAGSLRLTKRSDGEPVALALFQVHDPRGNVTHERKYVTLHDCAKGSGELVTIGADDTRVIHTSEFTAGNGSAGSYVADVLCKAAHDEIDKRRSTEKSV